MAIILRSLNKKTKAKNVTRKKRKLRQKRLREPEKVELREGEAIKEADTDQCISIWQSVIIQAIYDIAANESDAEKKAQALSWFAQGVSKTNKPTDFELVCELAELDPKQVMECVKIAKKQGIEILDGFNFRTLRKSSSNRKGRKTKGKKYGIHNKKGQAKKTERDKAEEKKNIRTKPRSA